MKGKQESTEIFPLLSLPKDLVRLIISFLDLQSVLNLRLGNYFLDSFIRNQILNHLKVAKIVCGEDSSFLIKADGTLNVYGSNFSQLKKELSDLKDIINIAAGRDYILALTKNGKVYVCGKNNHGQLGLGHNVDQNDWKEVPDLKNVINIAANQFHSLALTNDGKVYVCGKNNDGQLGLGHNIQQNSWVEVPTLKNIMNISAGGFHSLALTKDGKLYASGNNEGGQLGLGHNVDQNSWKEIALKDVINIAAGIGHSLALTEDSKAHIWGYNLLGELGLGHERNLLTPQKFLKLKDVINIAAGPTLLTANKVYARNIFKETELIQEVFYLKNICSIAASHTHILTLTKDDRVYSWGKNNFGQLGSRHDGGKANLQLFNDSYPQVKNSIIDRESKRKVQEEPISDEIRKRLINKINYLILTSKTPLLNNFFKLSDAALKLAGGLKDFINDKRFCTFTILENELQSHQTLNHQGDINFKECLTNLRAILKTEKERLAKSDTVRQDVIQSLSLP